MSVLNTVISWFMKKRMHQIELFLKYPIEVQEEVRRKLINTARHTEWGLKYKYADIRTAADFARQVPVSSYEALQPYIDRIMRGEQYLLWPSEIRWFAKSSGTTNDRSKFIPVSEEALEDCHYKGAKDLLSMFCYLQPETQIFTGKSLTIGGSHQISQLNEEVYYGDLSAVLMQNLPIWAEFIRTPELSVALLEHWEEKAEKIGLETMHQDVTSLAGVPTWLIVLFKWMLEQSGKNHMHEIWPNLEVYFHGGVSFNPYRDQFRSMLPADGMRYMETYNASEGFFGMSDSFDSDEMLLMLDYGIYFEFMDPEDIGQPFPKTCALSEVNTQQNYAVIISTNAGLWRYLIGDTIRFTNLNPFRFKITGRTKHFINAFGEELIIENAEAALARACEQTGARIRDYTAGPKFLTTGEKGAHEWLIEFEQLPDKQELFNRILDERLRELNSDYDAKRQKNLALDAPIVHVMPDGTFYGWMKKRGKLGGQNKVPRLANDRKFIDDILAFSK
ncbi:MAG: GH3 auxin-responsive promoter family protein [Bacteroidia bacterium]